MAKNIVVFSDGTGKDGGKGANSNVYKLFNSMVDRSREQIVFYDQGLGTDRRHQIAGLITGRGIGRNIQECYRFIFENFEAGDRIYLFGFSRGATTVRSLSAFIHLFGILPKSRPELIGRAYKIYTSGGGEKRERLDDDDKSDLTKREQQAKNFVDRHHTMWTKICVLGVWDTVAALGVPIRALDVLLDKIPGLQHTYHNLALSLSVENAYHALAIDEERRIFAPKVWETAIQKDQTMKQVWFPGVHSDVGGGYKKAELSDLTLEWMIVQAKRHGLLLWKDRPKMSGNPDGHMHDSRGEGLSQLYRKKTRSWDQTTHGAPTVHQSVVDRERGPTKYKPWILDGRRIEIEDWERIPRPGGADSGAASPDE